ncbi:hypothetical protein SUBVAR_05777 [Subdoligranulum variabile DSM 15176]|uniref:Uncharacterized protein n=1 Tax=Subdoligranulum variabile DSM 15176 TaxID=411471 RepID=D1PN61_9FIRM|nr:hypothetical protein SUBVAR_05777 [Subdoligranulum variabile DSM 15176]
MCNVCIQNPPIHNPYNYTVAKDKTQDKQFFPFQTVCAIIHGKKAAFG